MTPFDETILPPPNKRIEVAFDMATYLTLSDQEKKALLDQLKNASRVFLLESAEITEENKKAIQQELTDSGINLSEKILSVEKKTADLEFTKK